MSTFSFCFGLRSPLPLLLPLLMGSTLVCPVPAIALVPYTPQMDLVELRQDGEGLFRQAVQLLQFNEYEEALRRAELATQLIQDQYEVWGLVADLYIRTDRPEKALLALKEAEKLAPTEPAVLATFGTLYFRQKDYAKAAEYHEIYVALKPDMPAGFFELGNDYYMLKRYEQALATYNKAVALKADFWEAINNIGLVQYEQGEIEAAIVSWQKSVSINDKAAEPLLAIAVARFQQGNQAEGIEQAEAALRLDGRYGNLEFLAEQLWGDRILKDAAPLLAQPRVQIAAQRALEAAQNELGQ